MTTLFWTLVMIAVFFGFLYVRRGFLAWVITGTLAFILMFVFGCLPGVLWMISFGLFVFLALVFGVLPIRRLLITPTLMKMVGGVLPSLGKTERIALDAGTVWWDGDLFSGNPDWKKFLNIQPPDLTEKEKTFMDGPLHELCEMLDDWEINQKGDMPEKVWDFIKKKKFCGMIIPEEYEGLGFSALAHSAVITKLASRSSSATVTIMVPNSLGPAELILHYGTDEQKKHYLPRLAKGEEIPCFALTEPEAGSDAASMKSKGVVCKGKFKGNDVIGIRLNWNKRYITLSSRATLIGLAFRLWDPDHLIGPEEDVGITCALIPADLPGIEIGKRHDPMGVPFINGPTIGKDVFIPVDHIIGGEKMAGHGWRMLMQSLAAGRSISLPSLSTGMAQLAMRVVGAYATIRKQFNMSIGRFEGNEEVLARMAGTTYLMNAARVLTAGAVDLGEKPSVLSAVVKAYVTEGLRLVVNGGMDICAGSGISRGPRNMMSRLYPVVPIGITVEGANILTRSMIIYGQGAIRCHPYVREQMEAISERDVERFDQAFFQHINFVFTNLSRTFLLSLTCGKILGPPRPGLPKKVQSYFQQLSRFSAGFALISDFAMAVLGGNLKRKEKISGRLADVLAYMYLTSATLKYFIDDGQKKTDYPLAQWACEQSLFHIQTALEGILDNFPNRVGAFVIKRILFPWGSNLKPPSDSLGSKVARGLLDDQEARLNLTRDIHVSMNKNDAVGILEITLDLCMESVGIEKKIKNAIRAGQLKRGPVQDLVEKALKEGIVTKEEKKVYEEAEKARVHAIQVDAFNAEEFSKNCGVKN